MNIPLEQTHLMAYLKSLNERYHAKVLELRDAVKAWLNYIPETFPHYTRHTVEHSDEIVVQMSKLLFPPGSAVPVIQLSAAEVYIVIAAAYLHDSGMVTAEQEKIEIITSDSEWKSWIGGEGGGAKRWREIEELRAGRGSMTEEARRYVADLQTRYLIAEFVRRSHHVRAGNVIRQYEDHLGRFAFGDPMMQNTIAAVCVAHGLRRHELDDRERYPELRDVQGYQVNVRLMAILLRLGDLLDMSHDRACPLLLNAANPLPADSLAHWTQYQRLTQRATSPTRIEITAECQNQEEHRVLQDWCQWIVEEIRDAKSLLGQSELHQDWQPPRASLDGPDATIKIRPAQDANYIPVNWTFEIDHNAILQLLIRDLYNDRLVFIRELLQNALDAARCKMYMDLAEEGITPPKYPTQVSQAIRDRYSIKLKLETKSVTNELSGETEERQVFSIEDPGLGMDREIIQRYFLQVGRSFYRTEEFRGKFRFSPTSRFGVGFLSVFAVSEDVLVETYKPSSPKGDQPIRLKLRGPRNYLLTEFGNRRISGTRIEIVLHEPFDEITLVQQVKDWCRRVEFPVLLTTLGKQRRIVAEQLGTYEAEAPDVTDPEAKFVVKGFPLVGDGLEGEIYVSAYEDKEGERWDRDRTTNRAYLDAHPQAIIPTLPNDLICLHGIQVITDRKTLGYSRAPIDKGICVRVDLRHEKYSFSASRGAGIAPESFQSAEDIRPYCERILREHLETSPHSTSDEGWKYRQRLVPLFPFTEFWRSTEKMIPVYIADKEVLHSLLSAKPIPSLTTIVHRDDWGMTRVLLPSYSKQDTVYPILEGDTLYLKSTHLGLLSESHSSELFWNRVAKNIRLVENNFLVIDWLLDANKSQAIYRDRSSSRLLTSLPNRVTIAISVRLGRTNTKVLLNTEHPVVQWLLSIKQAADNNLYGLKKSHVLRVIDLIASKSSGLMRRKDDLNHYVAELSKMPDLPQELQPPMTVFTEEMFSL